MNPRFAPSGPFSSIGLFSLSAPEAFLAGVQAVIQFDRTDFLLGDSIGEPLTTPGLVGLIPLTPGLYLVQMQVVIDVTPTTLLTGCALVFDPPPGEQAGQISAAFAGGFAVVSGLIPNNVTPLAPGLIATAGASITATGAGGNISSARLLVLKLADAPG
jgi:hypothetical protein